jgi:ferredoxin
LKEAKPSNRTERKNREENQVMPYVVHKDCVLCSACISGCECGAIKEGETQCEIDTDICIECGVCESNCPSQAIHYVADKPAGS